ncbi:MAG TPA: hypothetical protein VJZ26_03165 [Blastocatellia bacterium]|nr:hypothetical protein [Blastocatellia bacterium]
MAEYPEQQIAKYDAISTKEAWPLIGLYLLAMIVTFAGLYIVGYLANSTL